MAPRSGWYNRFFSGLYSRVLGEQFSSRHTMEQVRLVKRLLKAREGQRVLDVPCGKGRIAIPLARAGLCMTGVDLTQSYLRAAARRARRQHLPLRLIHSDMRDIDFEEEFDAVFNWFGSFGYFCDAENLEFCRRVYRALKPGGGFLVQGPNKSWIGSHFTGRSEHTINGVRVVIRNRWDKHRQRVLGVWTLIRHGKVERNPTDIRIYNAAEMRALLGAAGFREIAFHDQAPGKRFSRHSRKLMVVARKPVRRSA